MVLLPVVKHKYISNSLNNIFYKGKQVLYMLPEIALTSQIIRRFKNILADILGFIIPNSTRMKG